MRRVQRNAALPRRKRTCCSLTAVGLAAAVVAASLFGVHLWISAALFSTAVPPQCGAPPSGNFEKPLFVTLATFLVAAVTCLPDLAGWLSSLVRDILCCCRGSAPVEAAPSADKGSSERGVNYVGPAGPMALLFRTPKPNAGARRAGASGADVGPATGTGVEGMEGVSDEPFLQPDSESVRSATSAASVARKRAMLRGYYKGQGGSRRGYHDHSGSGSGCFDCDPLSNGGCCCCFFLCCWYCCGPPDSGLGDNNEHARAALASASGPGLCTRFCVRLAWLLNRVWALFVPSALDALATALLVSSLLFIAASTAAALQLAMLAFAMAGACCCGLGHAASSSSSSSHTPPSSPAYTSYNNNNGEQQHHNSRRQRQYDAEGGGYSAATTEDSLAMGAGGSGAGAGGGMGRGEIIGLVVAMAGVMAVAAGEVMGSEQLQEQMQQQQQQASSSSSPSFGLGAPRDSEGGYSADNGSPSSLALGPIAESIIGIALVMASNAISLVQQHYEGGAIRTLAQYPYPYPSASSSSPLSLSCCKGQPSEAGAHKSSSSSSSAAAGISALEVVYTEGVLASLVVMGVMGAFQLIKAGPDNGHVEDSSATLCALEGSPTLRYLSLALVLVLAASTLSHLWLAKMQSMAAPFVGGGGGTVTAATRNGSVVIASSGQPSQAQAQAGSQALPGGAGGEGLSSPLPSPSLSTSFIGGGSGSGLKGVTLVARALLIWCLEFACYYLPTKEPALVQAALSRLDLGGSLSPAQVATRYGNGGWQPHSWLIALGFVLMSVGALLTWYVQRRRELMAAAAVAACALRLSYTTSGVVPVSKAGHHHHRNSNSNHGPASNSTLGSAAITGSGKGRGLLMMIPVTASAEGSNTSPTANGAAEPQQLPGAVGCEGMTFDDDESDEPHTRRAAALAHAALHQHQRWQRQHRHQQQQQQHHVVAVAGVEGKSASVSVGTTAISSFTAAHTEDDYAAAAAAAVAAVEAGKTLLGASGRAHSFAVGPPPSRDILLWRLPAGEDKDKDKGAHTHT